MSTTGAGVHEEFPVAGRRVDLQVDSVTNIQLQKPENFIQPATTVRVLQPFILAYENDSEVSAAQIDQTLYTVPTGFKLRVLDGWCVARGAEASATVKVTDGTSDIAAAMICAVDKVVNRFATGFDNAKWEIAAGGTLVVESTGGTNGPACNVYVMCALVPA